MMSSRVEIKDKLQNSYKNFLQYCSETRKNFVDELSAEDFIAYRTEYSVSKEEIEQLKSFIYSSEESFSGDSNSGDSLRNYFKIKNVQPYRNISVADLNFSVRSLNVLVANNCSTLGKLLSHSLKDLKKMKKLGSSSLDNILDTLRNFFESEKSKPNEVFQSPEEAKKFFDAAFLKLPESIKKLKLLPFVKVYNIAGNSLHKNISEDALVEDLPKYLDDNFAEMNNFVNWLNFDLNFVVEKIIAMTFRNERELMILFERNTGKSLLEVGHQFGLTRERVRQIELRSIRRFEQNKFSFSKSNNIFLFLYAFSGGKGILTLSDAEKIIDSSNAKILWLFLPKLNFEGQTFYYDDKEDAILFATEKKQDNLDVDKLVLSLPEIMEEEVFKSTVQKLVREKKYSEEVLNLKLSKFYKQSGKFFHRVRITVLFKVDYIFKHKFQTGYKVADETDYRKALLYLQEIFDEQANYSQRSLDANISILGVLCGRGKYIHRDFVHIPQEIVKLIQDFIERSDKNVLLFKEIFESLKDKFVGTQITNQYILQGVIKLYKLPYTMRRDYITKNNEINLAAEFNNFIEMNGEVSAQEIKKHFVSFNDANIALLLNQCPEIINVGGRKYLHSSRLNLQEKDFAEIEKFLAQILANVPISSRRLFEVISDKFPDFIHRNQSYSHEKNFGILRYMFRDKFYFSRPFVSAEKIENVSNRKVLLMYLEGMDSVNIVDLLSINDEHGLHRIGIYANLVESVYPEFIRVDESSLRRTKTLGITNEIISAVINEIKSEMERNGGWLSAKKFSAYERLPQLEISWNSFLLENIASFSNEKISVLKNYFLETTVSSAVFVSEKFAEYSITSFILKVLAEEHSKKPFKNVKGVFNWMKTHGLCSKTFPKFLKNENHIITDEYGKIVLK